MELKRGNDQQAQQQALHSAAITAAHSEFLAKAAFEAKLIRQAQESAAEQAKIAADHARLAAEEAKIQTGLLQRAAEEAKKQTRLLVEEKITNEQAFLIGYSDCYNDGNCYVPQNYGELNTNGTIKQLPPIWKENPFIYLNLRDEWNKGWYVRFNELMGEAINGPGFSFMREKAFEIGYSDMKNWDLKRKWADPNIDDVEITWTGGIADFIFPRNYPKLLDVYSNIFINENGSLTVAIRNFSICNDDVLNDEYRRGIEKYLESTKDEGSCLKRKNRHRVTLGKRMFGE